jgi:hypothetical protein
LIPIYGKLLGDEENVDIPIKVINGLQISIGPLKVPETGFLKQKSQALQFSDAQIRRHSLLKLDGNPYLNRNYFIERKDRIKKHAPWIQTRLPFFA